MSDAILQLNQAQRDRLAFIELQLRFFGEIRRRDLTSRFDIQIAAATRDLTLYRELASKNLDYDTKSKVYRYGKWFTPLFDFPPERVLTWLSRGYGDGCPAPMRPLLPTDSSGPRHLVNLDTLSIITRAIHQQKAVQISYHSLTSGQSTREFVPFALADNGFRWHVRGFDRKRQEFLDFVLTRIASAQIIERDVLEKEKPQRDNQWNRIVEMELVPHPANIQHPDTIEVDFGMTNGVLKINVRAALAGYLLRRWNVDCSTDHRLRGLEYQLWLRNRETLYGVANINLAPGYE
jgi:hypothetical protein